MRQLSELPRMDFDTKSAILGNTASGVNPRKRMQKDFERKGQAFSVFETKPIGLWQRLIEHFGITHLIDLTPGSGALAIAASGAIQYEGIAANETHCNWLDSVCDRCVLYMAGQDESGTFLPCLCPDDPAFVEKVKKYFSGTMFEARKMLHPVDDDDHADTDSSDAE